MKKNELLNLKRRLIALSLAGLCTFGLAGCNNKEENVNNSANTEAIEQEENFNNSEVVEQEETKSKNQFLILYEDCAVIIEPDKTGYLNSNGCFLNFDNNDSIFLSNGQYIFFPKENSLFTAEDYVRMVYGSEFRIEYIRSEEEVIKTLK